MKKEDLKEAYKKYNTICKKKDLKNALKRAKTKETKEIIKTVLSNEAKTQYYFLFLNYDSKDIKCYAINTKSDLVQALEDTEEIEGELEE